MNKKLFLSIMIIIVSFAFAFLFYPQMPEKMAVHWNESGQVNGYGSRFVALFLIPIISSAILLLFLLIPKIDPLAQNIKKFKKYFDNIILATTIFLAYLYFLTIAWNLGAEFNISAFMLPALGIIFFMSGVLMEKSEKNWFVGVRTPWTLSSENVWKKTNNLGGKVFKIVGILSFFGFFMPDFALGFIVATILLFSIFLIVYSYIEYKKELKN